MKITARTIYDVVEDYSRILESSEKRDINRLMLVRDCSDALRDGNVEGFVTEETMKEIREEYEHEVERLEDRILELEEQIDD